MFISIVWAVDRRELALGFLVWPPQLNALDPVHLHTHIREETSYDSEDGKDGKDGEDDKLDEVYAANGMNNSSRYY